MVNGFVGLLEPGCTVSPNFKQLTSQLIPPVGTFQAVELFSHCFGNGPSEALAGELRQFGHKPVGFFVLNVKSHRDLPFYLIYGSILPQGNTSDRLSRAADILRSEGFIMRYSLVWLLAAVGAAAAATHTLYVCGATSKGYVVGAPLLPSGLFLRDAGGSWKQLGFKHPFIKAVDYDPRDPNILYIAAGNGCIRSADGGRSWRITTGWDMTELLDVSVDAHQPDHIYIGLPDGIGFSPDQGRTWTRRDAGIRRKFTQAVRVDRAQGGRVLAGTELGVFLSEDEGRSWREVGAAGLMVTHLAQSSHDPRQWLATTQRGGLFATSDRGLTWNAVNGVPADRTLYMAAFDPRQAGRLLVCGWGPGVLVSEDGGRSWQARSTGLPSRKVWSAGFDPDVPGRLYASVHEEAVFVSPDSGRTWKRSGLEGSIVSSLAFVPEAGR